MSANTTNHRPQRKQLSDQLDRLDTLIDGLADHLPQAVADATRDGVRQAVRDVLAELLGDPDVVARLRAALPPGPAAGDTDRERKPTAFARLKSAVRTGVTRTTEVVGTVASRVKRAVAATRERVRASVTRMRTAARTLATAVPVGRFAAVAVGVGVLVAVTSYVVPHPVAAIVGGIGATVTTAAVQVGGWVRRSARSLGLVG